MISFLCDGHNVPWFFPRIVRRIDPKDVAIIYIPTFDYSNERGIHFSPGFVSLIRGLVKRKPRPSRTIFKMLNLLGIVRNDIKDFEVILDLLITLWITRRAPIREIFDIILEGLGSKYSVVPLVEPLTSTIIKTETKIIRPVDLNKEKEEIKNIEFVPKDIEICEKAIESINNSDKLVLFAISPLSFLYLKNVGKISNIMKGYKGQIIYVLPSSLEEGDKCLLRFLKAEPSFIGLLNMLNGSVDSVVFSEERKDILEKMQELKFSCLPMMFYSEDISIKRKIIDDFTRLLTR